MAEAAGALAHAVGEIFAEEDNHEDGGSAWARAVHLLLLSTSMPVVSTSVLTDDHRAARTMSEQADIDGVHRSRGERGPWGDPPASHHVTVPLRGAT